MQGVHVHVHVHGAFSYQAILFPRGIAIKDALFLLLVFGFGGGGGNPAHAAKCCC